MQKHDYELHMDDNGLEIDTLTDKQLLQVAEAIKLIKSKEAEEQHLNRIYWFRLLYSLSYKILQNVHILHLRWSRTMKV